MLRQVHNIWFGCVHSCQVQVCTEVIYKIKVFFQKNKLGWAEAQTKCSIANSTICFLYYQILQGYPLPPPYQRVILYHVKVTFTMDEFKQSPNKKLYALGRVQKKSGKNIKYQPSGEGGTRSPPAMLHRLQNPIWPPGGPKMADGVWKGVYS